MICIVFRLSYVIVLCPSCVMLHQLFTLCHVRSKTRSLVQMLEKPCVHSIGHIISLIIMELVQNVCLDEILDKTKMGHVGSETRSLGYILEKPCVPSGGYIISLIIMKLCQNICLVKNSDEFENGSYRVKN